MCYIVCPNCKRVVQISLDQPVQFDKCGECGHTCELAVDDQELQLLLQGIHLPTVAYRKICAKCHSVNPRQTGICLFCGGRNFHLQYDPQSIANYNKEMKNVRIVRGPNGVPGRANMASTGMYKVLAIFMGLIDFFFFASIGLEYVIGDQALPSTTEAIAPFISANFTSLLIVLVIALLLAGIISVFVLPRMKFRDAFQMSAVIGIIVGVFTILVSRDIFIVIISIIACGAVSGIGGLIGESLMHLLSRRLGNR